MILSNLRVFNKEGLAINLEYDNINEIFSSKYYFDENSSDTYKTLGFYILEANEKSSLSESFSNSLLYLYNNESINMSFNSGETVITSIEKVNNSSLFYTKWIYGTNIHNNFNIGDFIYFDNIASLPKYSGGILNVYQILDIKSNAIMVICLSNNSIALPSFTLNSTTKVVGVNILYNRVSTTTYNTSTPNSYIYANKKINLVTEEANNIETYTVANKTNLKSVTDYYFLKGSLSLTSTDELYLDIILNTSRIKLNETSSTVFNATTKTITVSYISPLISVGTEIIFEEDVAVLSTNNKQNLTVTAIDFVNKIITVSQTLTTETVACIMYLTTNKLTVKTSPIYTYDGSGIDLDSTLLNLLDKVNGLKLTSILDATYIVDNRMNLRNIFTENVFDVKMYKIDTTTSASTTITKNSTSNSFFCVNVVEDYGHKDFSIQKTDVIKTCKIYVSDIDSNGIDVTVNNTLYHTDFTGGTVTATLAAFYSAHAAIILSTHNITVTNSNPILTFTAATAPLEVPFVIDFQSLDFFYIKKKVTVVTPVQSLLSVSLNGKTYTQPFVTSNTVTLANFVTNNINELKRNGLNAKSTTNNLYLGDTKQLTQLNYGLNIGYGNIYEGVDVITETINLDPNLSFVFSNDLGLVNTDVNVYTNISVGGVVNINTFLTGSNNGNYNIIMAPSLPSIPYIGLSYQGPFFKLVVPETLTMTTVNNIKQVVDKFVGQTNTKIQFSFTDDSDTDKIFFYDFSGEQLKAQDPSIYTYTGIKPLINENNQLNNFILNSKPNRDVNKVNDPVYQQTVFDKLEFELPFINSNNVDPNAISPIQLFVGLKSEEEGVSSSVLNGYIDHNVSLTIEPNALTTSDMLSFTYNTTTSKSQVTLSNTSGPDFINSGLKVGMLISLTNTDNTADGKNVITSSNSGKVFKIVGVTQYGMELEGTEPLVAESNIAAVPKSTYPYTDIDGNTLSELRSFKTIFKTEPKLFLTINLYGQTEIEDERLQESIKRTGDKFKPEDIFIFKDYELTETGIDWKLVNIKRKEFIEIQPEIFNYISSYKAVYNALKFFGYENDLKLSEYYVNINPESSKYGKLYSHEELDLLANNKLNWKQINSNGVKVKNTNYAKTNKFSLVYKLTDNEGNYIDGVSRGDIQIKLFKLKKWLTDNIIVQAQLTDISSRISTLYTNQILNSNTLVKTLHCSDTFDVIDFNAKSYLSPLSPGSFDYNVDVEFSSMGLSSNTLDNFSVRVKTYNINVWNANTLYHIGEFSFNNGKVWKCLINNFNVEPSSFNNINDWVVVTDYPLTLVQIFDVQKFDLTPFTFVVNKNIDPHFTIEVQAFSGYGLGSLVTKSYSLDYGLWP